jgi:ribosome biogenesis GTPase
VAFDLKDLGWDDGWSQAFAPYAAEQLVPGRVAIEFNYIYRVFAESGELQTQHSGRLRHEAETLSAVGDWVAIKPTPGEAAGTIEAILPRRSKFSRKVAGELTEEQIVAASIDRVHRDGPGRRHNPLAQERYLILACESGAPVVILNKSDVAEHLAEDMDEIRPWRLGFRCTQSAPRRKAASK